MAVALMLPATIVNNLSVYFGLHVFSHGSHLSRGRASMFRIKTCQPRPEPAQANISKVIKRDFEVEEEGKRENSTFTIDFLNDSGASRFLMSEEELVKQGVPIKFIKSVTGKLDKKLEFATAKGEVTQGSGTLVTCAPFGTLEAYMLKNAPIAAPQALITDIYGKPYVHLPHEKPFYVMDPSRIRIMCPEKFRYYADRIEDNCPMFKMDLTFQHPGSSASRRLPAYPAKSSDKTEAEDLDVVVCVPDVPLDDKSEMKDDPTLVCKSLTTRQMIVDAASPEHKFCHFPHNPMCEICVISHMRQASFSRKKERKDDELPAVIKEKQRIAADTVVVAKSAKSSNVAVASDGSIFHFIVRDEFSGMPYCWPQKNKDAETCRLCLKFFVGPGAESSPDDCQIRL